jgi:hypothetical protein
VSPAAKWKITRRGGQLWIWAVPIGGASELIRTSFALPDGVEFDHVHQDDLVLWFQRDFPIDKLKIGWTPLTGLDVTWIGTPSVGGGN